jgi:hypothetical protein
MLDLENPRSYGLIKPAYSVQDPEVRAAIGGITKVYAEIAAGNLRATKDGKRTKLLAPDIVSYLLSRREQSGGLRPSPNPKARRDKSASRPRPASSP